MPTKNGCQQQVGRRLLGVVVVAVVLGEQPAMAQVVWVAQGHYNTAQQQQQEEEQEGEWGEAQPSAWYIRRLLLRLQVLVVVVVAMAPLLCSTASAQLHLAPNQQPSS
jgi:hypothetical protein